VSTEVVPLSAVQAFAVPTIFAGRAAAERRFWEFFTAQISNDNTRKAFFNAVRTFSAWCQSRNIGELGHVEPMHMAACLTVLQKEDRSAPTIKQHLAAIRMLFDWLVVGQVLPVNPAHAVRGPKHSVKKGKTPVLAAEEARALLDSIETAG
jgi:site-specific recombinase XerD